MKINNNVWYYPRKRLLLRLKSDHNIDFWERYICNHYEDIRSYDDLPYAFVENVNNGFDYSKAYPVSGGICPSLACQFRCNYCAYESGGGGAIISVSDAQAFVSYLVKNATIQKMLNHKSPKIEVLFLGGGEPTFDWNVFYSIVEYVKEICSCKGIAYELSITTNGCLSENKIEYLSNNFQFITVSFDGLPDIHNNNRPTFAGQNSFELVNYTLTRLNSTNSLNGIISTIWPDQYDKLYDMSDYIFNTYDKIKTWKINAITPKGRAGYDVRLNEFIGKQLVNEYIRTRFHVQTCFPDKSVQCSLLRDIPCSFECGAFFGCHPWLLPSGKVISCLEAWDQAAELGKIENGQFRTRIVHDSLAEYSLNERTINCKDCVAFEFCGGGCPIRFKNEEDRNYECSVKSLYWSEVLNRLSMGETYFNMVPQKMSVECNDAEIYKISFNWGEYNA